MWIWELGSSNGGNVNSIVAKARHNGVSTVMIKSGDGASAWSQFSRALVSTLHARGLRVCAWQYVYGVHPGGEAKVGAAAVADGADCLLIDAESEYEGRYVSAQTYIRTLRQLIGASFPVALAGFPYVDFHPAFPYSVFLGPAGAQYNVPQMYWFDIGTSVDRVYAHTYAFNRIYQRTISPLGQVYNSPPVRDIRRFRQLSRPYGAPGVSWWDWQEATNGQWRAVSQPVGGLSSFTPDTTFASLGRGAQGDVVVWAQEHLVSAGDAVSIDGAFGRSMKAAVENFQAAHGLPADGLISTATWLALLRYAPAAVRWTNSGAHTASAARVTGGTPLPKSAFLRATRNEIAGAGGAGRPTR
jgi:peptidoglycan hydrolase-like protein with peptidoglycan-binding domain